MLSSKHRVLTIVLVLMIVAIVGTMVLSACQIKQNTPPDDKDKVETPKDEQNSTPDTEQDTDHNQDADQDTDNDQDSTQEPPAQEKTEAEYKAMFLAQLPTVIENYYNQDKSSEKSKLSDINIKVINFNTGNIYFSCVRNNRNVFFVGNNTDIVSLTSYQNIYDIVIKSSSTFSFQTAQSSQEKTLANEIAEFALEQPQVQAYLAENGIDYSNYEVLNASNFELTSKGNLSTLTIKFEDNIFTMTIGGSTGSCSTQEEYLRVLVDGEIATKIEILSLVPYQELAVA